MPDQQWKPIAASLADPERRMLWAQIVVAAGDAPLLRGDLTSAERRRLDALVRAGLVEVGPEGDGPLLPLDAFGALLEHRAAASGIERFLRDGRIATWPRRASDRDALLDWAAERAAEAGERLDEATVTARLAEVSSDPATLRRDLVDTGRLRRTPDGAAYDRP